MSTSTTKSSWTVGWLVVLSEWYFTHLHIPAIPQPSSSFLVSLSFLLKAQELKSKFPLLVTALQIMFYFMSIYAPETLGIEEEFGDRNWPIRYKDIF